MDSKINFGSPSAFEFDQAFDSQYLIGLYDNDYVWVEEVFGTVLNTYDQDILMIQEKLSENNLENLRKAVHKMKPSYGFIGLMKMQERCQQLEDRCKQATSIKEVKEETRAVIEEARMIKSIITNEYDRLKKFNTSRS